MSYGKALHVFETYMYLYKENAHFYHKWNAVTYPQTHG